MTVLKRDTGTGPFCKTKCLLMKNSTKTCLLWSTVEKMVSDLRYCAQGHGHAPRWKQRFRHSLRSARPWTVHPGHVDPGPCSDHTEWSLVYTCRSVTCLSASVVCDRLLIISQHEVLPPPPPPPPPSPSPLPGSESPRHWFAAASKAWIMDFPVLDLRPPPPTVSRIWFQTIQYFSAGQYFWLRQFYFFQ